MENIRQEIILQSKLIHKNILKLYEYFEDNENMYIILEYCSHGNLYSLLEKKGMLSEQEAFEYFYQILEGLEYLHSQKIIHRDIKVQPHSLDSF